MKVKAIIAGALVAIVALCALGIGIGMTNAEVQEPTLGELRPIIPNEEPDPVEEEYIPQSYAPTNSFLEEGEIVYYGWKVDRDDPVVEEPEVEEPETPEKPELEPIKPIRPGCPHGYINPIFCPRC